MAWTWCDRRARSITCQVIRGESMKSWPKIDGALADYVDANWLRESPLKRRLREETAKLPQAGMQISAHQCQQITLLAPALRARRTDEFRPFPPCSSLPTAEPLPANGKP